MSRIVGISMVKDEVDVIEHTIRNLLFQELDHVLIADNGSTDGTRGVLEDLAEEFPCFVTVLSDNEVGYYQSRKISSLASYAHRELGARWVLPFDADEFWYSPFGTIAAAIRAIEETDPNAAVLRACIYDHVATGADPDDPNPFARIGWRRHRAAELHKVACLAAAPVTVHQGNHGAHYPTDTIDGQLIVRHFPYRSPEQFISKARNGSAAYAATDLPEDVGKHWRDYGRLTDVQLEEVFGRWFFSPTPGTDHSLTFDPAPWIPTA